MNKKVVTRFAPSPTGYLHSGTYRTAVFAYLFARKNKGEFILRIEDTDKIRSKKEYEDSIIESLKWLELDYDRFYRQSENVFRHKELLQKLINEGKAYISEELSKDGNNEIKKIVRFKNPNKVVSFVDLIRGEISMNTSDLGDFVIARNINEPLFHFAVVVDDNDEGVTHIIRGDDHIANTPRQILIYEALGFEIPVYAHLPLVLGEDKLKLSKRRGAKPVLDYKNLGFLPEAVLNFISMLGWHPSQDNTEIFTKEELIEKFELEKVQKAGAIFNEEKLFWYNKEYLKKLTDEQYLNQLKNYNIDIHKIKPQILNLLREKAKTFLEVKELLASLEFAIFEQGFIPKLDENKIAWKKSNLKSAKENLKIILELIKNSKDTLEAIDKIKILAQEKGNGEVLWPLRYVLSGLEKSTDPYTIIDIIGNNETIQRIQKVL